MIDGSFALKPSWNFKSTIKITKKRIRSKKFKKKLDKMIRVLEEKESRERHDDWSSNPNYDQH